MHIVPVCSVMSDSATPRTVAHQALLSRHFPGKNTSTGCHFLLQGMDLPDLGLEPVSSISCTGRQVLYHCATWEAHRYTTMCKIDNEWEAAV